MHIIPFNLTSLYARAEIVDIFLGTQINEN